MFRLQFEDGTCLVQDVSLAVLGWRLLVCHSNIATSLLDAILILHCGPQCFSHGACLFVFACVLVRCFLCWFGCLFGFVFGSPVRPGNSFIYGP